VLPVILKVFAIMQLSFSTLEIHFLFFKNEFREGAYTPCWVLVTYKKYSKAFRFLPIGRIMLRQQAIFSDKNPAL
jgi:hypothetical protein